MINFEQDLDGNEISGSGEGLYDQPEGDNFNGYSIGELDRGSGSLEANFYPLDQKGPLGMVADIFDRQGYVSILDAGCGTGNQLYDLVSCATIRFQIDKQYIHGHGVSDHDFSEYARSAVRTAYEADGLDYVITDLNDELPANAYDIIYSHETLTHIENPGQVVLNLWQALRGGGSLYFNADASQAEDIAGATDTIAQQNGQVSRAELAYPPLLVRIALEQGYQISPRHVYKVAKPAERSLNKLASVIISTL